MVALAERWLSPFTHLALGDPRPESRCHVSYIFFVNPACTGDMKAKILRSWAMANTQVFAPLANSTGATTQHAGQSVVLPTPISRLLKRPWGQKSKQEEAHAYHQESLLD